MDPVGNKYSLIKSLSDAGDEDWFPPPPVIGEIKSVHTGVRARPNVEDIGFALTELLEAGPSNFDKNAPGSGDIIKRDCDCLLENPQFANLIRSPHALETIGQLVAGGRLGAIWHAALEYLYESLLIQQVMDEPFDHLTESTESTHSASSFGISGSAVHAHSCGLSDETGHGELIRRPRRDGCEYPGSGLLQLLQDRMISSGGAESHIQKYEPEKSANLRQLASSLRKKESAVRARPFVRHCDSKTISSEAREAETRLSRQACLRRWQGEPAALKMPVAQTGAGQFDVMEQTNEKWGDDSLALTMCFDQDEPWLDGWAERRHKSFQEK